MNAASLFPTGCRLGAEALHVIRIAASFPREQAPRVRVASSGAALATIDDGSVRLSSGDVGDGAWFDPRDLGRAIGSAETATLTRDGDRWTIAAGESTTAVYSDQPERTKKRGRLGDPDSVIGTVIALAKDIGIAIGAAAEHVDRTGAARFPELRLIRLDLRDAHAHVEASDGFGYLRRQVAVRSSAPGLIAFLPPALARVTRALRLEKSSSLLRFELFGKLLPNRTLLGRIDFSIAGVSISVRTAWSDSYRNLREATDARGELAAATVAREDLAAALRTVDRVFDSVSCVELAAGGGALKVRAITDEGDEGEIRMPCRGRIDPVACSLKLLRRAIAACDGPEVILQTEGEPKRPIRFVSERNVAVLMPVTP